MSKNNKKRKKHNHVNSNKKPAEKVISITQSSLIMGITISMFIMLILITIIFNPLHWHFPWVDNDNYAPFEKYIVTDSSREEVQPAPEARILCSVKNHETQLFKTLPDKDLEPAGFDIPCATAFYRAENSIDVNGKEYFEVYDTKDMSLRRGYIKAVNLADDYLLTYPRNKDAIDIRNIMPNIIVAEEMGKNIPILEKTTAKHLLDVETALEEDGYCLKIYSAYRNYAEQKSLYETVLDPRFVICPDTATSWHSVGRAVDVSIVDMKTGEELKMPSEVYDFSKAAARFNIANMDGIVQSNVTYLTETMEKYGFTSDSTKWWHFEYTGEGAFLPINLQTTDVQLISLFKPETSVSASEMENIANGNVKPTTCVERMAGKITLLEDELFAEHQNTMNYGDFGHLSIPDVGLEMPLYVMRANEYSVSTAQSIVDAPDSACIMLDGYNALIGDHNYQGFDKLYDMQPGEDIIIYFDDGTKVVYTCTEVDPEATNQFTVADRNGVTSNEGPHMLWLYTCNKNSMGGAYITVVKGIYKDMAEVECEADIAPQAS